MEPASPSTVLKISFNTRGETVDETLEMLPQETLGQFTARCLVEVAEYFRSDWKNWYRLQGEIETDWLSEQLMYRYLNGRNEDVDADG